MIIAGMICLNEGELIGRNLRQHYNLFDKIVVVHGADRHYPADRVTPEGLSIDDTADIIRDFPDPDKKIHYIPFGWAGDGREGHGKTVLRDAYAQEINRNGWEGLLVALDADEFYTPDDFQQIVGNAKLCPAAMAFQYPSIHFWKNDSQIITGGYYSVQHFRVWRWFSGTRYQYSEVGSHNFPRDTSGRYLQRVNRRVFGMKLKTVADESGGESVYHPGPCVFHYGFCKSPENMRDKTQYYVNRGEGSSRPETTASRAAWFAETLPPGLKVHKWCGRVPEAMRDYFGAANGATSDADRSRNNDGSGAREVACQDC